MPEVSRGFDGPSSGNTGPVRDPHQPSVWPKSCQAVGPRCWRVEEAGVLMSFP
jgi:hypothetical protein